MNELLYVYLVGQNSIPEMMKNNGIWKDHIQLLIREGIPV